MGLYGCVWVCMVVYGCVWVCMGLFGCKWVCRGVYGCVWVYIKTTCVCVLGMRILVTLLLDTLPMLGNVLLLCFFVFFIFGIVGVQLWAGLLRNRCFLPKNFSLRSNLTSPLSIELENYYHTENDDESPFICSMPRENGMRLCSSVPTLYEEGGLQCQVNMKSYNSTDNTTCINWYQYYSNCSAGHVNPFKGAINFDNICYAWIAIFQVITLEGWVDIMYFVMDSHSFYNFIYFILLIIIGSFFMINLCLVVIATQFSETKQRESQLMREQRIRFLSNASTLASFSEPGSCYDELLKLLVHVIRKGFRQVAHRKRRKTSRQGSVVSRKGSMSVHYLVHQHHHHHYHYHLVNGTNSALGTSSGNSSSVRSTLHSHCHLEHSTPTRNSVPFAGPRPKNYPTLQPSTLMEFRSGSVTFFFSIPPFLSSSPSIPSLPPAQLSRHDLSAIGTLDPSFTFDPESCPYCVKALSGESEGTDGNETPGESDSEGIYEFTQDLHHRDLRDRRDSRQPRKRQRKLGTTVGRVVRAWRLVCDTFRKIVDSKYFGRGIMIAILINTLSMGIEYHEQPDELTNALEISNIVFTSLFALEMLLKVLVYGPFGYIKNPYNIFDGIIVVISVWEIVGQQGGGLSVLRTFRLMRVLKLVRFMPALQRQLVVLMKTMDNVATFCMLLMLFIFIFRIYTLYICLVNLILFLLCSLLWCLSSLFILSLTLLLILSLYLSLSMFLSHTFSLSLAFSLHFSFSLSLSLSVFPSFSSCGKTSHISTLGSAHERGLACPVEPRSTASRLKVPVNGHVDLKTSLTPPLITHTAATPMPVPKLPAVVDPALGYESRRGSNVSMELTSARSTSPYAPWSSASGWTSRRSSWNSVGHAPSLKRTKCQSGERRSLLSGEGGSRTELLLSSGTGTELLLSSGTRTELLFSFVMNLGHKGVCLIILQSGMLYLYMLNISHHNVFSNYINVHFMNDDVSVCVCVCVCVFSRFRMACNKIITHKMFDHIVLVIIFLNCITIAMERPRIEAYSVERIFLTLSNYIFTAIFVAEMTVKVRMDLGDRPYQAVNTKTRNVLPRENLTLCFCLSLSSSVISRAPGLKLVVETLMSSLKPIGNIVVICCAFFIIFGILGVQVRSEPFLQPIQKGLAYYTFPQNNINQPALMSLFVLASKDGWVDIMYDGLDAVGVDQQPQLNHNPWMLLYFISFLLIVSFFVLNMFVGVVVENFHKCRRSQEAEEAKRREEKRLKRMEKKRRKAQSKPYYSDYSPTRLLIHNMCTSQYLDLFITIVIGLNVITMAMEHYQQPKELDEALKICNYIFTLVFVLESVFKLVAFGFRRFFKDRSEVTLCLRVGTATPDMFYYSYYPNVIIFLCVRVCVRVSSVLKLLKMAVGMRALLDTVMQALPQVGNLGLLFMLLFFIFAALGVELFGDLICDELHPCEGLGRYATFKNFGMAFLLLFRVSTGDNWNGIMKDTLRDCQQENAGTCYNTVVSPIYFVSFVLTAQFVLVNVVIAVLMKHLEESNKEAKEEAELEIEAESLSVPQMDPGEQLEDNLLSVRKSTVGRTHSLPNDSYMFLPLEPFGSPGAGLAPGLASQTQTTGPQHIETINKALSGTVQTLPLHADTVHTHTQTRRHAHTSQVTRDPRRYLMDVQVPGLSGEYINTVH
uniref:Calcium channel, voltage-dependent, T type, alpha 1G subunit n=1 Tax=Hucho hucho TaxID=62062 RepID=A0A4W5NXD5_9TELE